MEYLLDLRQIEKKEYDALGEDFRGENAKGDVLGFSNYYMELNGKPFFGISGEFHFSRCDECRWEDEIIKMKMCGINIIATYVFWIHHEEEEGIFDFSGSKNLRKFVELCKKHGLFVIVRIGPFDHGEVRNGGLPDWLYGKPFEVRTCEEGFLKHVRMLYEKIAQQLEGLYYKDCGPVIAVQIDNEYMHSSAQWEITTGISNEWVFGGNEREAYMLTLQNIAKECGIITPFYTCTGWGGAITPKNMMPLWGGYAYRPWLFYSHKGEHPSTQEYVYQDFHNNAVIATNDFKPQYLPEERPYACCEMGGGMTNTYYYRFILPFKSVDAMANIKLASGCNFLGYYVFQGGSNPKGKHGIFLNEAQVPKISYDYQAPLGEFGQVREFYRRLKGMHYFCRTFGEQLCQMQTVIAAGQSEIKADDMETLRFAVRTNGESGFLFLNNFQDHEVNLPQKHKRVTLQLKTGAVEFTEIDLAAEENCILPFHFRMGSIDLVKATAQLVTKVCSQQTVTYVFLRPDGMHARFVFDQDSRTSQGTNEYDCSMEKQMEVFQVQRAEEMVRIMCLNREMACRLYVLKNQSLLFTDAVLLEDEKGLRLETENARNEIMTYPRNTVHFAAPESRESSRITQKQIRRGDLLDYWEAETEERQIPLAVKQVAATKYTVSLQPDFQKGLKDVLLRISYQGDIGHAFLDGDMISDNFANGDVWDIGLRTFAGRLQKNPLTIGITPCKEGVHVNVESAMAARMENVENTISKLNQVTAVPIYEIKMKLIEEAGQGEETVEQKVKVENEIRKRI